MTVQSFYCIELEKKKSEEKGNWGRLKEERGEKERRETCPKHADVVLNCPANFPQKAVLPRDNMENTKQ